MNFRKRVELESMGFQIAPMVDVLILLLIFFSGVLMLSLGIIGHYLARIYEEIKARPAYLIRPERADPPSPAPDRGDGAST